ncbi:MAG: STAS domain-containing protein [Verrucomicrobia bacterium]|nr:STAS domain-containing protein [Kiritimatiellia bacterium]MCP5488701.1 STAS domain-containing protein [Verrucomicrobiota bacterium]
MSERELEVYVAEEQGVSVIVVDGPVDSATIETFKSRLDAVCLKPGLRVLIDCSKLSYLNSRAIGLLVKYHRSLLLTRGRLALCGLNSRLVRTLDLLQLGKMLVSYPSKDDAMTALAPKG